MKNGCVREMVVLVSRCGIATHSFLGEIVDVRGGIFEGQ